MKLHSYQVYFSSVEVYDGVPLLKDSGSSPQVRKSYHNCEQFKNKVSFCCLV